jgi:HD superfamily phosphohydrolase
MDRMDYLTRDSYYSGVAEGVIGYKRIISMLNVVDDALVVEEKGIFSIEKFLVARHIMYWQVYLHKTSITSEQMLKRFIWRYKQLIATAPESLCDTRLKQFFISTLSGKWDFEEKLNAFITLDDIDIYTTLKSNSLANDPVLTILSKGILDRKLFKVVLENKPLESDQLEKLRQNVEQTLKLDKATTAVLVFQGQESSVTYDNIHEEIKILNKSGEVKPISEYLDVFINVKKITKYYTCFPLMFPTL